MGSCFVETFTMEYSVCDEQYSRRCCSNPRVELAQTITQNSARYLYLAACRSVAMCLSISIGNLDDGLVIEQDSIPGAPGDATGASSEITAVHSNVQRVRAMGFT